MDQNLFIHTQLGAYWEWSEGYLSAGAEEAERHAPTQTSTWWSVLQLFFYGA